VDGRAPAVFLVRQITDPGQIRVMLARIEASVGLKMLDRQIWPTGKDPQQAARKPTAGKTRIECE
jgi:hypothetical protein